MTMRWMGPWLLAGLFSMLALALPQSAAASLVEYTVTPENAATTDGIEVSSRLLPNGDLEITLRVAPAPMVPEPRLTPAPGVTPIVIQWQSPRVAVVVVQAAFIRSASIRVMRDLGPIAYVYELSAAAWVPRIP